MIILSASDILQLISHFLTGIFTVFQTTFNDHLNKVDEGMRENSRRVNTLNFRWGIECHFTEKGVKSIPRFDTFTNTQFKFLGVIATPSYVFYAVTTIVLAFNRLMVLLSPILDMYLFSPNGMKVRIN